MSVAIRFAARAVVCVVDGCCALGAATTGAAYEPCLCPGLRARLATEQQVANFRRQLRLI
jgi:hypothetical protein